MNQDKIQQLQLMDQSINQFLIQKQQFQMQLSEVDSALTEIKDKKEAYKIVGNIMVLSKKEDIESDLKKKKEILELRIKTIEKQEARIKEKSQILQKEAMTEMEKK